MYKIKYHPSLKNRCLSIDLPENPKYLCLFPFERKIMESNQSKIILSFEYNAEFKNDSCKEFIKVKGFNDMISILESLEKTIDSIKPGFKEKEILKIRYVDLINEFAYSGIMD